MLNVPTPFPQVSRDQSACVLKHLCILSQWFTNGLTDGQELKTFDGEILAVSVGKDATVSVNGAEVVVANLKAGNGVVHLINSVLTSPEENWRMLIGDVMAPVSNPPDDGGLSAKAADSIDSSIMGQKGEANWPAQVIDAVDSAPVAPTEEALPFSVVDVLANHSQLSTFLAASTDDPLGFYMMVETGAFTVFAPNNDAFVGFSAALNITIQELLSDPGLESIIKLHAVPGKVSPAVPYPTALSCPSRTVSTI